MSFETRPGIDRASVILIGCGNIGSRLLQSMARVGSPTLEIRVVEPVEAARSQARARFEEALGPRSHTLRFDEAPTAGAALAVIATDSRNRIGALRDLAKVGLPRLLVLEKFLFPRADDYREAAGLIEAAGATAFVNCSRSEWPGYAALKRAAGPRITALNVSGGDWGLACNGIHFLSILEDLVEDEISELGWDGVPVAREAKRAGYRELTGRLVGRTRRGIPFVLESLADSSAAVRVRVSVDAGEITIDEGAGTISRGGMNKPFMVHFASQLETVFERLLAEGRCALPGFDASSRLHLLALETLNEGFFGRRTLDRECPVT